MAKIFFAEGIKTLLHLVMEKKFEQFKDLIEVKMQPWELEDFKKEIVTWSSNDNLILDEFIFEIKDKESYLKLLHNISAKVESIWITPGHHENFEDKDFPTFYKPTLNVPLRNARAITEFYELINPTQKGLVRIPENIPDGQVIKVHGTNLLKALEAGLKALKNYQGPILVTLPFESAVLQTPREINQVWRDLGKPDPLLHGFHNLQCSTEKEVQDWACQGWSSKENKKGKSFQSQDIVIHLEASLGFEWPVVICVTRLGDIISKHDTELSSTRAISTLVVADIHDGNTWDQAMHEANNKFIASIHPGHPLWTKLQKIRQSAKN